MQFEQFDTAELVQLYQQADDSSVTKKQMESDLQLRSKTNNKYSKEDLFRINKTQNQALTVFLFPGTASYNIIGNTVTIDLVLTEEELLQILQNQSLQPSSKTYGHFKIKVLAKSDYTSEQILQLEEQGIKTSDIYDIM